MMADNRKTNFSLLDKCQSLLIENGELKAENKRLKEQLDVLKKLKENLINTKSPGDTIKDNFILQRAIDILENQGMDSLFKSNIHQKFAVIDERVVWYGSINLLSFGNSEENIMRLESTNIVHDLKGSMGINFPT